MSRPCVRGLILTRQLNGSDCRNALIPLSDRNMRLRLLSGVEASWYFQMYSSAGLITLVSEPEVVNSEAGLCFFHSLSLRETTAWMQEVEQRREQLPRAG